MTFKQSYIDIHKEVTNGRFYIANNLDDALKQFATWANDRRMTTSDIYAVAIKDVVDRQKAEIGQVTSQDHGMSL